MCKENLLTGVIEKIIAEYGDGNLITHEWLKKTCGLEYPDMKDYETTMEFVDALQAHQFAYMSFVDGLREELLEEYQMYLKNERGDGYVILRPEAQVQYGYDTFIEKLNKLARNTSAIMNNVRSVPNIQYSKDNDLRAKFANLQNLLKAARK